MAEQASIFDAVDETAELQALEKARAEIATGKGIPHERVRAWLMQIARGENVPPPTA